MNDQSIFCIFKNSLIVIWPIIKSIVSFLVPVVALVIAYSGLRTWRRQIKGTTEYDLARRVLKSTYELRDAISIFRSPIRNIAQIDVGSDISPEEKRFLEEKNDFEQRKKRIEELFPQYLTNRLEAEVLFGKKSIEGINDLTNLCNKIFISAHFHLRHMNPQNQFMINRESERSISAENERLKVLYAGIEGEEADKIKQEMDVIIKRIESY